MIFKELSNSFIFLIVSPVASNISDSFEKCFPIISPSPTHCLFSMWLITVSIFAVVSNIPSDSTHYTAYTVSRTDTLHGLLLWMITKLKHVLTRLITPRRLE